MGAKRFFNTGSGLPRVAMALAALGLAATPVVGQQAPSPSPTPVPMASPSPIVQATPTPIPFPRLTAAQASELTGLITQARVAQGMQRVGAVRPLPTDNDGLVRAALDYAHAVRTGRLDPSDFQEDWGLRPGEFDPMPGFAAAVELDRIGEWFRALPPPWSGYEGLKSGLATYRAIVKAGGWKPVPAGAALKEGVSGARVVALRKRLSVEDPTVIATGDVFDAELAGAVKRAQKRYGLEPDGIAAARTLGELNISADDRVRQIMANMERWRWLPTELPTKRIQVNIAAAILTVFEGDRPIGSMRAVTGAPGHETPMLQSQIHSIVLNPPWNVPSSIATRELWPKERANPGYFARNGFKVIPLGGGNTRLQQAAGPTSALGRYKFDFANPYAVYLHDTPAQSTFSRYDRLASHGCVRLERPAALAHLLLKDNPEWPAETIQATVESGETVRAQLAEPVSVYLLYWTAFAGSDGQIHFRADPYGWDGKLAEKIERRTDIQASAGR